MITTAIRKPLPGTVGTSISFQSISDELITEEIAQQEQTKLGYMPQGYGFYGFRVVKSPDGPYHAYWTCSNSCE